MHLNSDVSGAMMRDRRAALILLLILCSLLVAFPNVEIVKAEDTIYIKVDGSVEGTDDITQLNGNAYIFTDNIFGEIKVQRGNCVIDGAGYTLQGSWVGYNPNNYVYTKGIDLSNDRMSQPSRPTISNVTIKNMRIVNFLYGIECVNSNNNTIINCYIADCGRGINQPSNFLVANNTLASGIVIDYTQADNVITQNNMIPEGEYEKYPAATLVGVFLAAQPTVYMNYWCDYNGKDADGDGVGDTPYIINEDNHDEHPLMNPVEPTFIPEFPSWIVLPLVITTTLLILIYKKRLPKSTKTKKIIHIRSLIIVDC
jgi:hypothetical protein